MQRQEAFWFWTFFNYSEMHPVYAVIFIEKSYYDFLKYDHFWKHNGKITFDTGISCNFLENITYIVLDNFRKLEDNIDTELKKWIYLLSADTPERIMKAAVISDEFYEIISDVAQFCGKKVSLGSETYKFAFANFLWRYFTLLL